MVAALACLPCIGSQAQEGSQQSSGKVIDKYNVHQAIELGGHASDYSGSGAMWDTLVNLQSGPRILSHSLDMRLINGKKSPLFDHLATNSFGYGGDPYNASSLRISKGNIYDFVGNFRRNRQYFDYNLLANPLIPSTSNPFVPQNSSPHRFNTVRRMTDVTMTFAPLSPVSVRVGYSHNTAEGPSYSSYHSGADALLYQWWRNSTDTYTAGLDWKPFKGTTVSYDQIIVSYKGDTSWRLTGLNYQLSNGTPVSAGIDIFPANSSPCAGMISNGTTNPPTLLATCNGYLSYYRYMPTRTTFPTEQLRFTSSVLGRLSLTGRLAYSDVTSKVPFYSEYNDGLTSRTGIRRTVDVGAGPSGRLSNTERISINGDLGITAKLSRSWSVSNTLDFLNPRMPGYNYYTESTYAGKSLLTAPAATATVTNNRNRTYLSNKVTSNTVLVSWDANSKAKFSLGYRFRNREISNSENAPVEDTKIQEHWTLFGAALQPTTNWRINANFDLMSSDNAYTRISPRHIDHLRIRSTYKPNNWLNLSVAGSDYEAKTSMSGSNHADHARNIASAATISPSTKYSFELDYAYDNIFSRTDICYLYTPTPTGSTVCPMAGGTYLLSNGYYDQPTHTGGFHVTLAPVTKFRANVGYRMTAVNGKSEMLNPRQVPGSLQSQYQTPFADVSFDLAPQWTWKGAWNYYGYGEGSPIGPVAPRSFRGNVYTLSVKYAF